MSAKRTLHVASLLLSLVFLPLFAPAQMASSAAAKSGVVKALSDVRFEGDDTKCLRSATENGDPDTGPSTLILKAAPDCKVPWHYHTAEEQLIIVKGYVSTGMQGMKDTVLGPGGFAMMPSKAPHWFTCTAKEECLMFVTFDRAYDIVWLKPGK